MAESPARNRRKSILSFDVEKFSKTIDTLSPHLKELELDGFSLLAEASTTFGRLFWAFFLTTVVVVLFYELYRTVETYVDQPTVNGFSIVRNETMVMPIVLICPFNVVNDTSVDHYGLKAVDVMHYMNGGILVQNRRNDKMDFGAQTWISNDEVYDIIMKTSFPRSKMFLDCSFWGIEGEIHLPCQEIVREVLYINTMKCYEVSLKNTPYAHQQVENRALSLTINSLISRQSSVYNPKKIQGLNIRILDDGHCFGSGGVSVPGGVYMKLDLELQHLKTLNTKRNPCTTDDESKSLRFFNSDYSDSACYVDCHFSNILEKCGCLAMGDPATIKQSLYRVYKYCTLNDTGPNGCIGKLLNDTENLNQIDSCRKRCYPNCDRWLYKAKPTFSRLNKNFLSTSIENWRQQNRSNDTRNEEIVFSDIVRLDIAFKSLEYIELEQSWKDTFSTFIGNLGGQMNLWVGCSMISMINIPFTLFTASANYFFFAGNFCYASTSYNLKSEKMMSL
uniref:Uncharacterized protein n=1 Tax=Romanomermis culicivorax TaxID=13658 RepID=A0A915J2K6_ROMCU